MKLLNIFELWQWLIRTRKSITWQFAEGVVVLVFTLTISIATMKWVFSIMNIIKTRFHNKMKYDILTNYLILYIKREIVLKFSTKLIIEDFQDLKDC